MFMKNGDAWNILSLANLEFWAAPAKEPVRTFSYAARPVAASATPPSIQTPADTTENPNTFKNFNI